VSLRQKRDYYAGQTRRPGHRGPTKESVGKPRRISRAHRFTMLVGSRNLEHEETATKSVERMPTRPPAPTSRIRAPSQPQQSASGTRRRDASSTYQVPSDRSHGTRTRRPATHSQGSGRYDRRPSQSLVVATPAALLIGKGVRDVLPHSLGYWNDSAQKSAGNGNGCG